MSNFAGAGPCYQPYTDSIGSMPLPKYTINYSAYGPQGLSNARQISADGALLHQSSEWELEQELCGNYLTTQLCNDAQTVSNMSSDLAANQSLASITSGLTDMNLSELQQGLHYEYFDTEPSVNTHTGSDASSCPNPLVACITSGFYDMPMTGSSAYEHTLFSHPQVLADEYDHNIATQSLRQVEVDTDISTQGSIFPNVLDSSPLPQRRSPRRAPRGASSSSSRHLSLSPEPQQSELLTYKRRNVQVPSELATPASAHPPAMRTNRWRCPFCPYVQHNRRSPDLKRHIATHTRLPEEEAQWVCCGVPVFDAHAQGVPKDVVNESEAFEYQGLFMVGGCKKTFSRRDALSRHLRREEGRCFGDAFAVYQPGNRVGVMRGL